MANWSKLSALTASLNTKTKAVLTVAPRVRPYISQSDAVYDYTVGHDFTVIDNMSPLQGCSVTVCDRHVLKQTYGLTHLHIKFNPGMSPVEVAL